MFRVDDGFQTVLRTLINPMIFFNQGIVVQSGSLSGDIDYHFQNKVAFLLNFRVIYSSIYEFSHSENGPATYALDQTGNAKYESFIDGIAESLNSQWARNVSPADVSKDDRHVLRLAAVLHVLFDQLTKFLHGDEKCPPPQIISSTTLLRSIALCQYFTEQQRILDQVSGKVPFR